jgi:O-succinylbenzoic acid--CoA ligase
VSVIDATHFEWLGRYDNIINSGGIKLIPEQIEKKLSQFIPNSFFTTGLPDKKLGEKLVLIIEGNPIDLPDFSSMLSKYEIPKEIFYLKQFIRTNSGKIKRNDTIKLLNQ